MYYYNVQPNPYLAMNPYWNNIRQPIMGNGQMATMNGAAYPYPGIEPRWYHDEIVYPNVDVNLLSYSTDQVYPYGGYSGIAVDNGEQSYIDDDGSYSYMDNEEISTDENVDLLGDDDLLESIENRLDHIERELAQESMPMMSQEGGGHTHAHYGATTCQDGHTHLHPGVTGTPIPTQGGHVHKIFGNTTFDDGHIHYYEEYTSPSIPLPDGYHTHYVEIRTTENDGHIHIIRGFTAPSRS